MGMKAIYFNLVRAICERVMNVECRHGAFLEALPGSEWADDPQVGFAPPACKSAFIARQSLNKRTHPVPQRPQLSMNSSEEPFY